MRNLSLVFLLVLILLLSPALKDGAFAAEKPALAVAFAEGNSEVSATVIEQLRNSGKFDILTFNPDLPTISRAVMEKKIPSDAVRNPSDAEKATLIARALGAQYAVRVQGSVSGSTAKVTLELSKIPDGRWITTAESEIAGGEGPRAAANRINAISTAASSAVSQLFIEAFGGLPEPSPAVEAPPAAPDTPSPAPSAPESPKTVETTPVRDITAQHNDIIRKADSYAAKGDLRNAVIELKRAVNLEPDKLETRVRLAKSYADLGMTAEAVSECKRALLFDKDSTPVYALLAKLYTASGSLEDAAEQYNQVIRADPKNVQARLSLGDINWNLAKMDESAAAYEAAADADPKNPAPHDRLQRLYAARKMYPQAFEHLVESRSLAAKAQDSSEKYGVIAEATQDEFNLVLGKLDTGRTDYDRGKITREEYYKDCQDAASRIEALADFLSKQTAPREYKDLHPRGVLAASLLSQATGYLVSYFETEQKHYLDDADLLKSEAKTEMNNFVAGLKTLAGEDAAISITQGNG